MIVLDANILIRAVLGRRVRQLIDTYAGQGVRFFAPDVAFDDAEKYLPPLLKSGASPTPTFRHPSSTWETSSKRLLPTFMPSLKAKPDSDCAVETKVIGQYSPQHSDWHVQCGPKMRIFSVLASRCGLQVESRFFSRHRQSRLNLRRNEILGRGPGLSKRNGGPETRGHLDYASVLHFAKRRESQSSVEETWRGRTEEVWY
jgi:hypothetical protein